MAVIDWWNGSYIVVFFFLRCACCFLLEVSRISPVSLVVLAIRLALFFIVTHKRDTSRLIKLNTWFRVSSCWVTIPNSFSQNTSSQFCKARRFDRVAPAIFKILENGWGSPVEKKRRALQNWLLVLWEKELVNTDNRHLKLQKNRFDSRSL